VKAEKTQRLLRLGVVLTSLYILVRDWRKDHRKA
jgi:hypothetical protein